MKVAAYPDEAAPGEAASAAGVCAPEQDFYTADGAPSGLLTGVRTPDVARYFIGGKIEAYVSRTLPYGVWLNDGSWVEVGPAYQKLTPMAREGVYVLLGSNVPPDDIAKVMVGGVVDDFQINQIFETVRALHRYGVEGVERGFIPDIRKDDHRSDYKFLSGDSGRVGSTLWEYRLALWYAQAGMEVELEKEFAVDWSRLAPEQDAYLEKEIEPNLDEAFRKTYRHQDRTKVDLFVRGFGKQFVVETKRGMSPGQFADPAKRAELELQVRRHALVVEQHGLDGKDFVVRTWDATHDPNWAKNVAWLEGIHVRAGAPFLIRGGFGVFAWSRFGGFAYNIASKQVAMPLRALDDIPAEEPVADVGTSEAGEKRGPAAGARRRPVKARADKAREHAKAAMPWNREIAEWLKRIVPQGLPRPKEFDRAEDFIAAIQKTMRKGVGEKTARNFAEEMGANIEEWLSAEHGRLDRQEKKGASAQERQTLERERQSYEEILARWQEFRQAKGNKTQQGNLEALVRMAALATGQVAPAVLEGGVLTAVQDETLAALRVAFLEAQGEFRVRLFNNLAEVRRLVDEGKMELEIIRGEDPAVAQGDLEDLWKEHANRMKTEVASIGGRPVDVGSLVALLEGPGAKEEWAVDLRSKGKEIFGAARDLSRSISAQSADVSAAIEEMTRFDVQEQSIMSLYRPLTPPTEIAATDGRKIVPPDTMFDGFERADEMREVSKLTGEPIDMERVARGLVALADGQERGGGHSTRLSPEAVAEIRDLVRVAPATTGNATHDVFFVKWDELRRKGYADLRPSFDELAAIIGKRTRLTRLLALLGAKGKDLLPGREFWLVGRKLPNGEVVDLRLEPSKVVEGPDRTSCFQVRFRVGKLEGPVPVGVSGEGALKLVTPFRVGGVELGRAETALVVSWLVGEDRVPEGEMTLQEAEVRELLASRNVLGRLEQLHKAFLGAPLPSSFVLSGKRGEGNAVAAFTLVPGDALSKNDPETFELLFERTPKHGFALKGVAGSRAAAFAIASLESKLNRPLGSVERAVAVALLDLEPQGADRDSSPTEGEMKQFFHREHTVARLEELSRAILGKEMPKILILQGLLKEVPVNDDKVDAASARRVSDLTVSERSDIGILNEDGFVVFVMKQPWGYVVDTAWPKTRDVAPKSVPETPGKGEAMESRAVDLSAAVKAKAPPAIGAAAASTAGATALSFGPVAPDEAMKVAAKQTVRAVSGMARGAAVFGFGLVGADIVTGDWEALKERSALGFLREYGALTAGNLVGQATLVGPNELLRVAAGKSAVAAGLGRIMNRSVPLFTALIALDVAQGRTADARTLTLSAANILAASATVRTAIDLAKGMPWAGKLATALKLAKAASALGAPETGGATLLGLGLTSVAEFVLLKKISDAEEWWAVRTQRQRAVAAVGRYEELLARTGGGDETVTVGELAEAKRGAMEASAAAFAYFEQRREVARLEAAGEVASWTALYPEGGSRLRYHQFMIGRALAETLAAIDKDEAEATAPVAGALARVEELERETIGRLAALEPGIPQRLPG